MEKKLTQNQIILALAIRSMQDADRKGTDVPLMAPHHFMGEWFIEETQTWYFVSYEASARLSGLNKKYPGLFNRDWIRGKSGAEYYGYRIADTSTLVGEDRTSRGLQEMLTIMNCGLVKRFYHEQA